MSDMVNVCRRHNVRAKARLAGKVPEGWTPGTNAWRVKLSIGQHRMTVSFYTGPAITGEPSAADVLSCLTSDAQAGEMSFPEFCREMGYDDDSRKAKATHRACVEMSGRLRLFLGNYFDEFAEAQH